MLRRHYNHAQRIVYDFPDVLVRINEAMWRKQVIVYFTSGNVAERIANLNYGHESSIKNDRRDAGVQAFDTSDLEETSGRLVMENHSCLPPVPVMLTIPALNFEKIW